MDCPKCEGVMGFLEANQNWWCNTCLEATPGERPAGTATTAHVSSSSANIGFRAVDALGWLIGGLLIVAGIAVLWTGWTTVGWALIGVGVVFGILGP